jgi:hypothetical protein
MSMEPNNLELEIKKKLIVENPALHLLGID